MVEKLRGNQFFSKCCSVLLTALLVFVLKRTHLFTFTMDSLLPYVFYLFLFFLIEYRRELSWENIRRRLRPVPLLVNIATVLALAKFYTCYEFWGYAVLCFIWVLVVLVLLEAVVPLACARGPYLWGGAVLALLYAVSTALNESYDVNVAVVGIVLTFFWVVLFRRCFLLADRLLSDRRFCIHERRGGLWVFVLCLTLNILLCVPAFLLRYPGILTGDSLHQMAQILGQEVPSNHHPWYYTMLISFWFRLGSALTGTANGGFAAYTIFSLVFMAGCFAAAMTVLYRRGLSPFWLVVLEMAYALDPIKQQHSLTMWKDIIFSGCMLLLCVGLVQAENTRRWYLWFAVLGLLVCLMRNNGIFVMLMLGLALLYCRKFDWKKLLCSYLVIVMAYVLLINVVCLRLWGVKQTEAVESWSVPLQQIAFVISIDGDIDAEEYNMITAVVDPAAVREAYCEWDADYVKNLVRPNEEIIKADKWQYFRLWLGIGVKNPYGYLHAWFEQTKGYWYHRVQYKVLESGGTGFGMEKHSLLPAHMTGQFEEFLFDYENETFSEYYSLGLQTYLCLFLLVLLYRRKSCWYAVVPPLGNIVTLLIAAPIYAVFRYAYPAYCFLPLGIGLLLVAGRDENATKSENTAANSCPADTKCDILTIQ